MRRRDPRAWLAVAAAAASIPWLLLLCAAWAAAWLAVWLATRAETWMLLAGAAGALWLLHFR